MGAPVRTESELSVRLGRPGFYRVQWETHTGPAVMKGAAWSAGEGDYVSIGGRKYCKMGNREAALAAAAGGSGGAAATLPGIFFDGRSSLVKVFKNATRGADEAVEGEDCYVLKGDSMGMKVSLWVAKGTFLMKQRQIVLAGKPAMADMSEADMDKALKQMGNLTPEQRAQAKATMKSMKPMLARARGTVTETYRDIKLNEPVSGADFNYELPAGALLSKSLW
jgi:hypothetical protein